MLGFGSDSVYIAGLDHALRVEFPGGRQLRPTAESTGASQSGTMGLGKVTCQNVWDNIDVIYAAAEGGIAESTYIVHPGGNPTSIKIRYNAPVDIQQNGSLRFSFNNGYMSESAPVAWQEIAAFVLKGLYPSRNLEIARYILRLPIMTATTPST